VQTSTATSSRCSDALDNQSLLEVKNLNAEVSAEDYSQTNDRGLRDYKVLLVAEFSEAVDSLTPQDLFIDSGGGMGIAARQVAVQTGAKVVVVNPQDYRRGFNQIVGLYGRPIKQILDRMSFIKHPTKGYPIGIELRDSTKIGIGVLKRICKILEIPFPDSLDFYLDPELLTDVQYSKILRYLLTEILEHPHFLSVDQKVEVGFTENILPSYENQAKLIADVYAAFYYSPNRIQILRAIFGALLNGGKGYLFLGDGVVDRTNPTIIDPTFSDPYRGDEITLKDGITKMTWVEWLSLKYPEVFSLKANIQRGPNARILVIHKEKGIEFPNLEKDLELVWQGYYVLNDDVYAVPHLKFKEK
jgi:hypothetical protein